MRSVASLVVGATFTLAGSAVAQANPSRVLSASPVALLAPITHLEIEDRRGDRVTRFADLLAIATGADGLTYARVEGGARRYAGGGAFTGRWAGLALGAGYGFFSRTSLCVASVCTVDGSRSAVATIGADAGTSGRLRGRVRYSASVGLRRMIPLGENGGNFPLVMPSLRVLVGYELR